jgi:hypothetical protein
MATKKRKAAAKARRPPKTAPHQPKARPQMVMKCPGCDREMLPARGGVRITFETGAVVHLENHPIYICPTCRISDLFLAVNISVAAEGKGGGSDD